MATRTIEAIVERNLKAQAQYLEGLITERDYVEALMDVREDVRYLRLTLTFGSEEDDRAAKLQRRTERAIDFMRDLSECEA